MYCMPCTLLSLKDFQWRIHLNCENIFLFYFFYLYLSFKISVWDFCHHSNTGKFNKIWSSQRWIITFESSAAMCLSKNNVPGTQDNAQTSLRPLFIETAFSGESSSKENSSQAGLWIVGGGVKFHSTLSYWNWGRNLRDTVYQNIHW